MTDIVPDEIVYCGTPVVASTIKDLPAIVVEQARRIAERNGWYGVDVCGYGDGGVFVSEREATP